MRDMVSTIDKSIISLWFRQIKSDVFSVKEVIALADQKYLRQLKKSNSREISRSITYVPQ